MPRRGHVELLVSGAREERFRGLVFFRRINLCAWLFRIFFSIFFLRKARTLFNGCRYWRRGPRRPVTDDRARRVALHRSKTSYSSVFLATAIAARVTCEVRSKTKSRYFGITLESTAEDDYDLQKIL